MPELLKICTVEELELGVPKRVDIEDHRVAVIWFGEDDIKVVGDECSHADYSLAAGEIDTDEMTIECPKHGAVFSLESGKPESLPATKPIPVYTVQIQDDNVFIEIPENEKL